MKQEVLIGQTDFTDLVKIRDDAGAPALNLVAANLTVSYTRVETDNDVVNTDVTSSMGDLTALTDAHTDWGVLKVSDTLAKGVYRIDIADAVFASGARTATVHVTGTGLNAEDLEYVLVPVAPSDGVNAHTVGGQTPETVADILADPVFDDAHRGTATAGGASTITLETGASTTNDFYNGAYIKIVAGTGVGQRRFISDYVGGTLVATVDTAWVTQPDATSEYVIL